MNVLLLSWQNQCSSPYKPNIYYIKHISTVTLLFMLLNFHGFPQLLTQDTLREMGPN